MQFSNFILAISISNETVLLRKHSKLLEGKTVSLHLANV